jgi:NADPH:quinone reductase-like Zn-dependent oxidoreductase
MRARPDGLDLSQLADRLADGRLSSLVEQEFRLEQARDAHVLLESGHVHGKLVLNVE